MPSVTVIRVDAVVMSVRPVGRDVVTVKACRTVKEGCVVADEHIYKWLERSYATC